MKNNLFVTALCLFLFLTRLSVAQIGIGTTAPDPSAQLDVRSTSKGVLLPRVASTANVPTPAEGLLVYQTTAPVGFYVYKSGNWVRLITADEASPGGAGTMIPYASGKPVTMRGGSVKSVSLVGFGNSTSTVYLINGAIDLTGGGGSLVNFAFPVSQSGTIRSIAGYFNNVTPFTPATSVTITAQLYQATGTSNSFTPISGAVVNLTPVLNGTVAAGAGSNGLTSGLAIPVTAGTRLLLVFSLTVGGQTVITVDGYVSGSVTIN
ncbi:exosporium glycoprotein BclB-related protein [Spirosoma koreense]